MELFLATFQAIVTLLGVGVLGFILIAKQVIPENILAVLNRLALDIALPFLVFSTIILKFDPQSKPDWWMIPLWWVFFLCMAFVFSWIATRVSRTQYRSEFMMAHFFQNATFVPLALLTGIFGLNTPYLVDLFIFNMFHATLLFSTYHLFFRSQHKKMIPAKLLNYVLLSAILAVGIKLTHLEWAIPKFILSISLMIGNMSLPLLMMVLGGNIYRDLKSQGQMYWSEITRFIFFKIMLFPACVLGIVFWISPPPAMALILIIQAAVPPIISVPALIENCGGNRNLGNQMVVFSFLVCMLSIPFFIWLAGQLQLF